MRPRVLAAVLLATLALPARAQGVQHWGFGHGSLATLQKRDDGSKDLVVYEAPLRAKDGPWLVRWRFEKIAGPQAAAFLACGDFRPKPVGKAFVVVGTTDASGLTITAYDPPEVFSSRPWAALPAKNRLVPAEKLGGTVEAIAGGNIFGGKGDPDALCVLIRNGDGKAANWFVGIVKVPLEETQDAELTRIEPLPVKADPLDVAGFAIGDFWGTGEDSLCFPIGAEEGTHLKFFRWGREVSPGACFVKIVEDIAPDVPVLSTGGICAGDFVKDGFDAIALVPADPAAPLEVRVAPSREPSHGPEPGPFYSGHMPSRQPWPGFGAYSSLVAMRARPEGLDKRRDGPLPIAAGPIFGYVRVDLDADSRMRNVMDERADAGICCAHRALTPVIGEEAPHYGWPLRNEETTWQIVVMNHGKHEIPGGTKLKVWLCADAPNADLRPGAKPDVELLVERMEGYLDEKPDYKIMTVKAPWPYDLVDAPAAPDAKTKWKRIDLSGGEKWLIASLDLPNDPNERDNRIEVPWHGFAWHPVLRDWKNLLDARPMVPGDPPGLEYLMRKTADAANALWARAGTATNEDTLVRIYFDGFDVGWPDDAPEKEKPGKWKALRERYDGVRQLETHWGGAWERLDWKGPEKPLKWVDPAKVKADELKDVALLFHPLAGMDEGILSPTMTGLTSTPRGNSVQLASRYWNADILTTGTRVIGVAAAEYGRRFMAGIRGVKPPNWTEMAPDKVSIRILDRDGSPVSFANVAIFPYGSAGALASGTTDSGGKWNTGHPFGPSSSDVFGRKRFTSGMQLPAGTIVTVGIGAYEESHVLGADDPAAHSRLALFLHSMTDPALWTVDIKLNWSKKAPEADFSVEAPVQGTTVELTISGPPNRKYRLYRRWEPAWIRTPIGEYPTSDGNVLVPIDLSAPDSWGKGRTRATFEVTALLPDGTESLPVSVCAAAIQNALGLAMFGENRFGVAATNGDADPFGLALNKPGFSLDRELVMTANHGHAARKLLRGLARPSRLYTTLKADDQDPASCFEMLEATPGAAYERRYDLGIAVGRRGGRNEFRVKDPRQLGELTLGDVCTWNTRSARVVRMDREAVFVDKPIFDLDVEDVKVQMTRAPGRIGDNAPMREMSEPRGLMVLPLKKEFLALCDTGNNRVVIWDETTRYVCGYGGEKFRPCALALDPRDPHVFFVVDRRADRKSHVLRLTFNGLAIERDHAWNIDVGDFGGDEQGLACMRLHDENDRVRLAITDGEKGRILFVTVTPDRLVHEGSVKTVVGPHAGPGTLEAPMDCLFVPLEKGTARLFVLDAKNRVVEGGAAEREK